MMPAADELPTTGIGRVALILAVNSSIATPFFSVYFTTTFDMGFMKGETLLLRHLTGVWGDNK